MKCIRNLKCSQLSIYCVVFLYILGSIWERWFSIMDCNTQWDNPSCCPLSWFSMQSWWPLWHSSSIWEPLLSIAYSNRLLILWLLHRYQLLWYCKEPESMHIGVFIEDYCGKTYSLSNNWHFKFLSHWITPSNLKIQFLLHSKSCLKLLQCKAHFRMTNFWTTPCFAFVQSKMCMMIWVTKKNPSHILWWE